MDTLNYSTLRISSMFECGSKDTGTLVEPYLQKINSQNGAGHSKYRLCATNLQGSNLVWVELKMNVQTNPYFMDHEEGFSLVTSVDMRNLHDRIHNTTNKLM